MALFLWDLRTGADSGGAGPPFCLHFGDLWCTFGHLGSSLGSPGYSLTLIREWWGRQRKKWRNQGLQNRSAGIGKEPLGIW